MTDSLLKLKLSIVVAILLLLALSIGLWFQTPQLFEYFNQAFCAHYTAEISSAENAQSIAQ